MAQSISFLLSSEAADLRAVRSNSKFVIHAEVFAGYDRDSDRIIEIDADDLDHAHNLAHHWVENFNAVSAAIRRKDAMANCTILASF